MKNNEEKIKNNALVIQSRQVSFIISGVSAVVCCAFLVGYFIGKKEDFDYELKQSVRAIPSATLETTKVITAKKSKKKDADVENTVNISENQKQFCANLTSFATKKHADQFVKKLAKQGINVYTKERKSSSDNGSLSTWYQVITAPNSNKKELETLVSFLTKQENLQGVTIVTYT